MKIVTLNVKNTLSCLCVSISVFLHIYFTASMLLRPRTHSMAKIDKKLIRK